MFYLFSDIFIDFDYKQNIVNGNCIILSKEFGAYQYSKEIDSVNLNIPKELLHKRLLVSNKEISFNILIG